METSILETVGKIAGIGGLSLGVFLILFQSLLKKIKVPGLKQSQWYTIILVFMILVWSVAISGMASWYFSTKNLRKVNIESAFTEKNIPVFSSRVHLGDNVFSRQGGMVFPSQDEPTISRNEDVVYYHKDTKNFSTYFGATTGAQFIAKVFGDYYKNFNLDAWENVVASSKAEATPLSYEGSFIQIDSATVLSWHKGQGNFYDKTAAIARTRSVNIFKELINQGVDPRKIKVTKAWLRLNGFHGGRRKGQSDNLYLLIDSNRYPVEFGSDASRNEEFLEVEIEPEKLDCCNPSRNTIISLVVLPYQEQLPIPPPDLLNYKKIGPAHFRDVEIGNVNLVLQLST